MKLFSVKAVPVTSWSSAYALNFRPRALTLFLLCLGLFVFGIGEALMIAAGLGVSPWTVLAQGIAAVMGLSIGWATFSVSLAVLLLWIPLRQVPGLGTILNAVIIALAIELSLPYLPTPSSLAWKLFEAVWGILLVGLGSGIYLVAHLGAGPRDGLMTGLQRVSSLPIAVVRLSLEITVVVIGWLLGGIVGLGTLLFAIGIGPAVSAGLYLVAAINSGPDVQAEKLKSEA